MNILFSFQQDSNNSHATNIQEHKCACLLLLQILHFRQNTINLDAVNMYGIHNLAQASDLGKQNIKSVI